MSASATANGKMQVNTNSASNQFDPSITTLADGGWVVVCTQAIGGRKEVTVFQRYAADGSSLGAETQLPLGDTLFGQLDPVVTALANGGFIVAWEDESAGEFTSGIFTQRYDVNGTANGEVAFADLSGTVGTTVPSITTLDDGGWPITWTQSDGIYQQRFDAGGVAAGAETKVNSIHGSAVNDYV